MKEAIEEIQRRFLEGLEKGSSQEKTLMRKLPSTESLQKKLKQGGLDENEANVLRQKIALAKKRDGIQSRAPQGCMCLGLGGTGLRTLLIPTNSTDGEYIDGNYYPAHSGYLECATWEKFCVCEKGQSDMQRYNKLCKILSKRNREIIVNSSIARAGIPPRFSKYDFKIIDGKIIKQSEDCNWSEIIKIMTTQESLKSFYLYGPPGVGKTVLSVSYVKYLIRELNCRSARWVSFPMLLQSIRSSYNQPRNSEREEAESDILQAYQTCSYLVLDDMGAEHVKDLAWLEDKLYSIIGYRHDNMLPTMITSNLPPDNMAERIGDRIMWRIVEDCGENGIIEVKGKNLRDWAKTNG